MLIRLPDGSEVELIVGSKVILSSPVFGDEIGVGPFEVVSFEGDLPVLLLIEGKEAPVSVDQIKSVSNPVEPKVEVVFPDGTVVVMDADLAPVVQAILDANAGLMKKLADIISGDELKNMQAKLDAMQAERDAAIAYFNKIRGALPQLEALQVAVSEIVALVRG